MADKYTCNIVFKNENGKSLWVAEKVIEKFKGSSKTKLSEVIVDIQSKYLAYISTNILLLSLNYLIFFIES